VNDVYEAVRKRANGRCELCGKLTNDLQMHHVVSGYGRRKAHESVETCIMLCVECHAEVHRNAKLDRALKLLVQERLASKGLSTDEIRNKMGGKLY